MGYRIEYGQTMTRTPTTGACIQRRKKFALWLVPFCLIAVVTLLWGRVDEIRDLLIPGNTAVTEVAISQFVNDLRAGQDFGDAITAFCREIIENANISE